MAAAFLSLSFVVQTEFVQTAADEMARRALRVGGGGGEYDEDRAGQGNCGDQRKPIS